MTCGKPCKSVLENLQQRRENDSEREGMKETTNKERRQGKNTGRWERDKERQNDSGQTRGTGLQLERVTAQDQEADRVKEEPTKEGGRRRSLQQYEDKKKSLWREKDLQTEPVQTQPLHWRSVLSPRNMD